MAFNSAIEMKESNIQQLWDKGEISFWAVVKHYFDEDDTNGIMRLLGKLETNFIVPRSFYDSEYQRLGEMAVQYNKVSLSTYLRKYRGIVVESKDSFQSFTDNPKITDINLYIETYGLLKIGFKVLDDDLGEFERRLESSSVGMRAILCFTAGKSGTPDTRKIAMRYNPNFTLVGMAEVGNRDLLKIDRSTLNQSLAEEIYKRLLINQHENLFMDLSLHIGEKATRNSSALQYGSRKLIRRFIQKNSVVSNLEAFDVYNHKFNKEEYQYLVVYMKLIRGKLPENIFEVMLRIPEELRYRVFDYTMDQSVFSAKKSIPVRKALLIASLEQYKDKKRDFSPTIQGLISDLGVEMEELETLLPNNQSLKEEEETPLPNNPSSNRWIYIIVILILLSIVGYKYYKSRKR